MLWPVFILFILVFRSGFGFLAGNLCLLSLDSAGVEIFSFFFFKLKNKNKNWNCFWYSDEKMVTRRIGPFGLARGETFCPFYEI